jgi:hypothetical protein
MANHAARQGLATLGDLAKLHPAELVLAQNLGRKSIADTRAVIEPLLGMSWEEAALSTDRELAHTADNEAPASRQLDTGGSGPAGWDDLRSSLAPELLDRPLSVVALPARIRSFARSRQLSTVGALVQLRRAELLESPNLGRGSIADALKVLASLTVQPAQHARAAEWRSCLVRGLAGLPLRERMVLTQRLGLAGPPPTLHTLGESLGVSRERVRQLEAAAIAELQLRMPELASLSQNLAAIAPAFAEPIDQVLDDGVPLLSDPDADVDVFAYFLANIAQGTRLSAFRYNDTLYFGRATESEFTDKLQRLQRVCEALVFPVDRETLPLRLGKAAALSEPEFAVLFPFVQGDFLVDQGRAVGFGTRRDDEVRAFLRAQGKPVSIHRVAEAVGSRGKLPMEIVWIDRGMITLPELVPDFARWRERMGPLVAMLIAEHGDDRQWTTAELLPLVATVADLPEWANAYTLGSLLRDSPGVTYLGRNVVTLASADASERTHVGELAEQVLEASGTPLSEDELVRRIRAQRGIADNTWLMLRMRRPFVLIGDGLVGLVPRDAPGDAPAMEAFANAAFAWLEERGTGVGSRELRAFLLASGGAAASWDLRLARSVLRHDARFRQSQGGGLGLAVWGDTRAPNQREVLEALLEQYPAGVPLAEAIAAIPTASGDPMPRERLGLLARACNARLHRELIVRDAAPASERLPDNDWAMRVPEKAAPAFSAFLRASRSRAELRQAVHEWRAGLLCSDNLVLDRRQVRRLADQALLLLEGDGTADEPRDRAVRAAVEYLVCIDDAESDVVVGGLDDDEAVLGVVG